MNTNKLASTKFLWSTEYRLPAVYVGLPMLASLSALHDFLPLHPASTALVALFHATVADLTADVRLPMMAHSPANPNLMVLAIGAGSLLFSYFNDSGFWLFKGDFNLSVRDTLRPWSARKPLFRWSVCCS